MDVAAIRAELDHPIVDADGHVVEALPVVVETIRKVAGDHAADRLIPSSVTFATDGTPKEGSVMAPWWTLPTDARDRATSFLPKLLHERLEAIGLRQSSSRYMFNHIGNFAASADAFAKSLFFGGVLHRFPQLHVAFLECGAGWAAQLVHDLVDRWEKRGPGRIDRLDPANLDR